MLRIRLNGKDSLLTDFQTVLKRSGVSRFLIGSHKGKLVEIRYKGIGTLSLGRKVACPFPSATRD